MVTVHYKSHEHKARVYVAETLPAIFRAAFEPSVESQNALERWMKQNITGSHKSLQLVQLHDAARAGKYVAENLPQDEIRTIAQTLTMGGDCEDWAVVLIAACRELGISAKVATSGDANDNFLHVYIRALGFVLDPKGSQLGVAFNVNSENNPIRRYWNLAESGELLEVSA